MDLVYDFLEKKIKLNRYNKIVIGVSAGPDSMCLLYILLKLREKLGFSIIVAHINHNVREESVLEEQFLKDYCKDNNLIFECIKIENIANGNFHQEARKIRYNFYRELIDKYSGDYLMTAHHGDDLVETVLMRLVRGSTLSGYSGFSDITDMDTYKIVRPLIYITKNDIELFNQCNKIPFYIDKSNTSDKYTRNRYRKEVLPFLKEEERRVHLKFLKFSNTLKEYTIYIEKVVQIIYNKVYMDGSLNILLFNKEEDLIKKLIIDMMFKELYSDMSKIEDKHCDLLIEFIQKNKGGSEVSLPNNLIAYIEYDYLYFKEGKIENKDYKLELVDGLILPNKMQFKAYTSLIENGNDTCYLMSKDIKLPLYVRNRKIGDKIALKGMDGSKKVSDLFIDKKISKDERDCWPIVVDANDTIIWVPKLKKSKYDVQNKKNCDIIFKCL